MHKSILKIISWIRQEAKFELARETLYGVWLGALTLTTDPV